MSPIFSAIREAVRERILIVGFFCLFSLSGLFIFTNQAALADQLLQPQDKFAPAYTISEATVAPEAPREQVYDEVTEEISSDPKQGLEEIYEEDLEEYREEKADDGGLVKGAKDMVNKVMGKD